MTQPLQTKDDQWRGRRHNGASPIFDPGLAPLGSDEEAGGAPAPVASRDERPRQPLPLSLDPAKRGPRFTAGVWWAISASILALLVLAAWFSIPQ